MEMALAVLAKLGLSCSVCIIVGLLQKVALDQLVFSPVFLGVFFTYNGILEGLDWSGIQQKFHNVCMRCTTFQLTMAEL